SHALELHFLARTILRSCRDGADFREHVLAFHEFSENGVVIVEPWSRNERDEKLASIRVRTRVCHRKNAGPGVLERRIELVFEAVSRPSGSLPEAIPSLNHEVLDDPVKDGPVIKWLLRFLSAARIGVFFLARGKTHEVFHRLGSFLFLELDDHF